MDSDRNAENVTPNRRQILGTVVSIGLTAGVAGCQDTGENAEPTGTSTGTTTETETIPNTETETGAATETQGTLQRDGANPMPASPISTHPQELLLEASDFGADWEILSSETILDDDLIYSVVDDGEQATGQTVHLENTVQGTEILYGTGIFTDADAAAEVITMFEGYLDDSGVTGYDIDIGDASVLYTIEADGVERNARGIAREQNATVEVTYFGPDNTDLAEWPDTVRPMLQSAHAVLADSY